MPYKLFTASLDMFFYPPEGGKKIRLGKWKPSNNAEEYFNEAVGKLKESEHAEKILKCAEESSKTVFIFVSKNDIPAKYWSPEELKNCYNIKLDNNASMITWNPKTKSAVMTNNHHKPSEGPCKDIERNNSSHVEYMESFMVLLHEFGHHMQFLKDPYKFEKARQKSMMERTENKLLKQWEQIKNGQRHGKREHQALRSTRRRRAWSACPLQILGHQSRIGRTV